MMSSHSVYRPVIRRGPRRIASSVTLQKLLYYESYWSFAWWLTVVGILLQKYMKGLSTKDPDEVRTIFVVIFAVAQPIKLLTGYYGNLKEQIPQLATMVLLSVIPLLPCSAYLLIAQEKMEAHQQALQIPHILFNLAGIVLGIRAIVRVLRAVREQQPYMMDEDDPPRATRKQLDPIMPDSALSEGERLVAAQLATLRTQKAAQASQAQSSLGNMRSNTLDEPIGRTGDLEYSDGLQDGRATTGRGDEGTTGSLLGYSAKDNDDLSGTRLRPTRSGIGSRRMGGRSEIEMTAALSQRNT